MSNKLAICANRTTCHIRRQSCVPTESKKKLARPRPISVMMSAIRWQLGWICTL